MPKPFKEWTVLPHGKLTRLDDNLLCVTGDLHMPLGDYPRRMTVVRLYDSRLAIYSAIALEDDEMRAIEDFGDPAYLIVPGDLHRMDAKIWKDRYPNMMVLAPAGIRERVEKVVPVDQTTVDFGDPGVLFVTVPGTEAHEAALVVRTASGTTLVVNNLIWNLDDRPGFGGWILGALGFTGTEPRIPPIVESKPSRIRTPCVAARRMGEHCQSEPDHRVAREDRRRRSFRRARSFGEGLGGIALERARNFKTGAWQDIAKAIRFERCSAMSCPSLAPVFVGRSCLSAGRVLEQRNSRRRNEDPTHQEVAARRPAARRELGGFLRAQGTTIVDGQGQSLLARRLIRKRSVGEPGGARRSR